MSFRLKLLGIPTLENEDGSEVEFPIGKPLALLSFLAFEDRPVRRTELARLLWPDSSPERARHSVRQAIWLIRRKLGEDAIQGDDPVSISEAVIASDVRGFRTALSRGDMEGAAERWRGPFLSRLVLSECREWEQWREEQREVLRLGFFKALLHLCEELKAEGEEEESLRFLDVLLRLNPYSLEGRVLQIQCLLDVGRVQSARRALEEARRELEGLDGALEGLSEVENVLREHQARSEPGSQDRVGESLEMVGRADELATLRTLWRRVLSGHPGSACIQGPAGIGKTRLANAFLAGIEAVGGRAVRAKGFRGEHRIPWGTVTDLVRQLLGLPGAKGISPGSDAVLRAVLPSLITSGNGSGSGNGDGESGDVHPAALADAVADLVGAVGFEGPLAILVDDWQWADKESRALLGRVMRQARGLPCFLLLAERTGERRLLQERAETLVKGLGGPSLTLGPLPEEELGELLGLLAAVDDPDQVDDLVRRIHRVTGGNPLFVGELLRKLWEEGVYRREGDEWILEADKVPKALDLPESVQELIRERLERLSPTAAQVAGALATERRSVPSRVLRRKAGLDEAVFTRAVSELVDREVLAWAGPHDLDFEHDQLREAARWFFQPRSRGRFHSQMAERPGWIAFALAASASIVVWILAALSPSVLGWAEDPSVSPYGAGQVLLVHGDSVFWYSPPTREGGPWTAGADLGPIFPAGRSTLGGVYRDLEGRIRWFGGFGPDSLPPLAVEFLDWGSHRVLHQSEGDVGFRDFSTGTEEILLFAENLRTDAYDHDLVVLEPDTRQPQVIYHARERILFADWSPNGQHIAVGLRATTDTLALLTPLGAVLRTFPLNGYRRVTDAQWCSDDRHLVIRVESMRGSRGVLLDTFDGSRTEFGGEFAAIGPPICLGPALAAIAWVSDAEAWTLRSFDLRTEQVERLPHPPSTSRAKVFWIEDEPQATIRAMEIADDVGTLQWGLPDTLRARGIRADGRQEAVLPTWAASDPNIVSVDAAGVVVANGVGQTWVKATLHGWITDSIQIRVEESDELLDDMLDRLDFSDPELPEWWVYGEPKAVTIEVGGDSLLSLTGDGRYRDGIWSRSHYPLQQGGTLELEFRLPLKRRDRERIGVCLGEDVPSRQNTSDVPLMSRNSLCFVYPSNEQLKFQSDLAAVVSGAMSDGQEVSFGPDLPSDDWVHLALQIRADGAASVYINRRLVHSPRERLDLRSGQDWRIDIYGASVDTDLWVRNLTLWRGERFNPGPSE